MSGFDKYCLNYGHLRIYQYKETTWDFNLLFKPNFLTAWTWININMETKKISQLTASLSLHFNLTFEKKNLKVVFIVLNSNYSSLPHNVDWNCISVFALHRGRNFMKILKRSVGCRIHFPLATYAPIVSSRYNLKN